MTKKLLNLTSFFTDLKIFTRKWLLPSSSWFVMAPTTSPSSINDFYDQQEVGIEGYCPQVPTSDLSKSDIGHISNPNLDRDPPPGGFPQPSDHVVIVTNLLNCLIVEDGKNVALFGHSSGGFVATASALPEFQAKHRSEKGLVGGPAGISYACGFVISVGDSIHSFLQPKRSLSCINSS